MEWSVDVIRKYLDGRVSADQLYRYAFDLLGYKSARGESGSESEQEADLAFQFTGALWSCCLTFVLHDDEYDLQHYMPQWLHLLETGEDIFDD